MSKPEVGTLDPRQRKAVGAPGSVAVVAGAGTGKTRMLAERYLHHMAEDGISPLGIVAVTFTESAADGLRARIRGRAVAASISDEALDELEAAQIGTVHALCARICREHPTEAGVPSGFDVFDPAQGRLWEADRLNEVIEALPRSVFATFPYALLRDALAALLEDPISAEDALRHGPDGWEALAAGERASALRILLEDPSVVEALTYLASVRRPGEDLMEEIRIKVLQNFEGLKALQLNGTPQISEIRALVDGLLSVKPNGGSPETWGADELARVKKAVALLQDKASKQKSIVLDLGSVDRELTAALPVLKYCFRAAREGLERAKRRARVLSFSDLEVHALRALEDPEVLAYYGERWKAILVDEFQDTNEVQARLLDRLWQSGVKLTIVGDEKQAIYGFRRAKVSVFRRFRGDILASGGIEVDLASSYRSHGGLVGQTNVVLGTMLGDLRQDLKAYHSEAPHTGPHVRAYAMEKPKGHVPVSDLRRAEGNLIGRLIEDMVGNETLVRGEGGPRPVTYGDFAVLSRAWAPLEIYGEALEVRGVPTMHAGGGSLLGTREAKDGVALLRFLANHRDDVALFAALRGPLFAVDDHTLHRFALEREREGVGDGRSSSPSSSSWWSWLQGRSLYGDLDHARETLGELMKASPLEAPSAVLARADRLTGFTAVLANLAGAARREADWRGFVELVGELERPHESADLVVGALKRLIDADVELPRPKVEAEDAVSLTTIHAAKGREWPVVIVPDLARPPRSSSASTLFDPELGVAVKFDGGQEQSVLYRAIVDRKKREEEDEARRLFYVAPTRARDHLILTSTSPKGRSTSGINLLLPGLDAAGISCEPVPFDPRDAALRELPLRPVQEPESLLL